MCSFLRDRGGAQWRASRLTHAPLLYVYPAQFRLSISPTVQCGEMRIIIFRATIFVAANGTCDTLSARYERAVVSNTENATRLFPFKCHR